MRTQSIRLLALVVAVAALFAGCRLSSPETAPDPAGTAVEIQVRPAALARAGAAAPRPTDSARVRVTGEGMDSREFGFGPGTRFSLTELTPGRRHFEVTLYRQGRLLYAGEAESTLHADRKNSLFLHCLPRFSRLAAALHLPLDFPRAPTRGEMRLDGAGETLSAPMARRGEFLFFVLEEVPGDRDYALSLDLWDSAGAVVASGRHALRVPMGEDLSLDLPLSAGFSQLQIGLELAEAKGTRLSLSLPAGFRTPASFGEVVFTEFHPAPAFEDSGSHGEWLELFNRTSDTLNLGGCLVARDGGGSSSKQALLPAGTRLAPGRTLVLGRRAARVADLRFPDFALANALSRMTLSCGALSLDSLTYSLSAADSAAIPAREGRVSTLRPERMAARTEPGSWCLVETRPSAGPGPTPGRIEPACDL